MASSCFEETIMRPIVRAFVLAAVALAWSKPASAQTPADIVLLNGKIVTVDDRFTVAEALAIKGERTWRSAATPRSRRTRGRSRAWWISIGAPSSLG
jgi:hypothetical protein